MDEIQKGCVCPVCNGQTEVVVDTQWGELLVCERCHLRGYVGSVSRPHGGWVAVIPLKELSVSYSADSIFLEYQVKRRE